jgi:hypothetical protein
MGYDVALLADIELPGGALAKWKKRKVDVSAYDDWPEVIAGAEAYPLGKGVAPTVGKMLDALRDRVKGAPFALREEGGRVQLAALLRDALLTLFGAWVAAALRSAGEIGGHGRVDVIGFETSALAFSFEVGPAASVRNLDPGEVRHIAKTPQYAWIEQASRGKAGPLPAFEEPRAAAQVAKKKAPAEPAKAPAKPAKAPAKPAKAEEAAPAEGFAAAVSGELVFPKRGSTKWAKTKVSPGDFADWPPELRGSDAPPTAPKELDGEIAEGRAYLLVTIGDMTSIQGLVHADALSSWGARLGALFRAAAAHGARGRLRILAPAHAPRRGIVVEVSPGAAVAREATAADWAEAAESERHRDAEQTYAYDLQRG